MQVDAYNDDLSNLEHQLKDLWSEYVKFLDKDGFNQTAKALREKYFRLHQTYRRNKNWRKMIGN
jgi:hypothetical protein